MTAATVTPEAERTRAVEGLTAGGFVLVPVPHGTKGPTVKGWNTNPAHFITTPSGARDYLGAHPGAGVGLLHSENQTAALDVDSEYAARALAAVGIDLAALLAASGPKVRGRRGVKPLYRVPDGLSLKPHALGWPDPSGKKGPGGRVQNVTLFELRAGPVQDVMPPSIHPDTGQAYTWEGGNAPRSLGELPELPPELLTLWQNWKVYEPVMKAACPWAPAEVTPPSAQRVSTPSGAGGESVVSAFNTSRTVGAMLNLHGYTGPERGPWLYPGSESKHAGVRLLPGLTPEGHAAVYSHHAADPLGDGVPRDAFGVWALLEHGVDVGRAQPDAVREVVKAAARFLGLPQPGGAEGITVKSSTPARNLPAQDWGEVRPLPPFTEPVPELPGELLPRPLAAWIEAEARAAGLPLEGIATPVLGGASGLINRRLSLRNVPSYPATTGAAWTALCAPPGAKKSWAIKLGSAGLDRAERADAERRAAERSVLEARRDIAAAQVDALQTRLKNAYKGGTKPSDPPSEDELAEASENLSAAQAKLEPLRFTVRDATIETVAVLIDKNPYGLTQVSDELTAWLGAFAKSGRENDRSQWLELANGDAVLQVDRMSRPSLYVPGAAVGVLGGIQPAPLTKLLDGERQGGDGLLQRFQLFVWPDRWPEFNQEAQHRGVDREVREGAAAVLDVLPTLTAEVLGSVYPSGDAAPLTYTPEAQAVFNAWEVAHERAKRDMSKGEAYRSHISKQPGTFARLALTFHALSVAEVGVDRHPAPAQVGEESAALAGLWCEYLTPHARKLWSEGRRRDVLDAREVLRFIERGSVRDAQKVSEVRAALAQGKAGMTGPRLTAALELLEGCGAVRVEKLPPAGERGGRPSPMLRIHPQALDAQEPEGGEL
ncbi:DUF3987 domain-containing protein [Deinococcus frigens]|uniref:DUF3987 domain-containing protein n=1 Tax=Deinococcus frigens TaxID=249403 RepID=UPI000496050B|nr:DUF3987 domain-containing protein [Deinococcus frigens]